MKRRNGGAQGEKANGKFRSHDKRPMIWGNFIQPVGFSCRFSLSQLVRWSLLAVATGILRNHCWLTADLAKFSTRVLLSLQFRKKHSYELELNTLTDWLFCNAYTKSCKTFGRLQRVYDLTVISGGGEAGGGVKGEKTAKPVTRVWDSASQQVWSK